MILLCMLFVVCFVAVCCVFLWFVLCFCYCCLLCVFVVAVAVAVAVVCCMFCCCCCLHCVCLLLLLMVINVVDLVIGGVGVDDVPTHISINSFHIYICSNLETYHRLVVKSWLMLQTDILVNFQSRKRNSKRHPDRWPRLLHHKHWESL